MVIGEAGRYSCWGKEQLYYRLKNSSNRRLNDLACGKDIGGNYKKRITENFLGEGKTRR